MKLAGKRVVVMGLGRFGGGLGVLHFAVNQGANVLVTDTAPAGDLRGSLKHVEGLPIELRLGRHEVEDFRSADLIVVNPAVDSRENVFLAAAHHAGVPCTSEIRLLVDHLPNRGHTIGVTGTAGKSTVTAMIGHMLRHGLGRCRVHVGGNLGGSLLTSLDRIQDDDWVVLELSSFMLEGLAVDQWSPHIAVLTNLTPNHLDRHGSLAAYVAAKQNIFRFQTEHDQAILPGELRKTFCPARGHRSPRVHAYDDDPDRYWRTPLLVPGRHNRMNAVLAAAAGQRAGLTWQDAEQALATFPSLPHRLQLVAEHAGVRYFNDSKSTTPSSAMLALESFEAGVVHAILGGYDKGISLNGLVSFAMKHCRAVYTVGATDELLARACAEAGGSAEVVQCGAVDLAMAVIHQRLRRGEVVLLSPGCASWDQFENYEQRGAAFVEAMLQYTGEAASPPVSV